MYEKYLKGQDGLILTLSDAKGTELQNAAEERVEPIPGNTLTVSLDVNIQKYAEQAAYQVMEKKGCKGGLHHHHESSERRDLRDGECAGI